VPQSLANVLVHVIYSTKNREPFLRDVGLRRDLEAYLAGTLEGTECPALGLRTVAEHLHALYRLTRTVTIARLVETMRTESSKWIKRPSRGTPAFGSVSVEFGTFGCNRSLTGPRRSSTMPSVRIPFVLRIVPDRSTPS
jgi:putative transposase